MSVAEQKTFRQGSEVKSLTGCARFVSLIKRKENEEAKKGSVARLGEYFHFYSILYRNSCMQCIY